MSMDVSFRFYFKVSLKFIQKLIVFSGIFVFFCLYFCSLLLSNCVFFFFFFWSFCLYLSLCSTIH
jgi:hypothetical protein